MNDGATRAFLQFIADQRAYHANRIKDFPDDELLQAVYKAHSAALDAMVAMVEAGHHPRQITLALVAAASNAAGRMSYLFNDTSLPLMFMQTAMSEMNLGIEKQRQFEAMSSGTVQ